MALFSKQLVKLERPLVPAHSPNLGSGCPWTPTWKPYYWSRTPAPGHGHSHQWFRRAQWFPAASVPAGGRGTGFAGDRHALHPPRFGNVGGQLGQGHQLIGREANGATQGTSGQPFPRPVAGRQGGVDEPVPHPPWRWPPNTDRNMTSYCSCLATCRCPPYQYCSAKRSRSLQLPRPRQGQARLLIRNGIMHSQQRLAWTRKPGGCPMMYPPPNPLMPPIVSGKPALRLADHHLPRTRTG